ncbi:response regulator transcription factor [soil metagenome]
MFECALIVEDIATTREWMTNLVHSAYPLAGVYHAGNLRAARDWFVGNGERAEKTIALVDIGLPDGSGIDLIREVATRHPNVELVVTTIYDDDMNLLKAMAAGAHSYLLKDRPAEELIALLRRIGDGEAALSPPMARLLLGHFRRHATFMTVDVTSTLGGPDLTGRETEVLGMIGRGLTLNEAGRALSISSQTVATHVKSIYRKLGITSRAEAALAATRRQLT